MATKNAKAEYMCNTSLVVSVAISIAVAGGCRTHVPRGRGNMNLAVNAIKSGDLFTLQTTIRDGLPVDSTDASGDPLISIAVQNQQLAIAKFLLNKGASPDIKGLSGFTPLMLSTKEQYDELSLLMISKSKSLNQQQAQGFSVAHFAAQSGDIGILRTLIDAGADVNLRNVAGETPLIRAARTGAYSKVARSLLVAGADPKRRDKRGRTASDWIRVRSLKKDAEPSVQEHS